MASNPRVVARRSVSAAACRSIRTSRGESSRGYSSTTTGVGGALDAGTLRLGRWTGSCATGFTTDSSTASGTQTSSGRPSAHDWAPCRAWICGEATVTRLLPPSSCKTALVRRAADAAIPAPTSAYRRRGDCTSDRWVRPPPRRRERASVDLQWRRSHHAEAEREVAVGRRCDPRRLHSSKGGSTASAGPPAGGSTAQVPRFALVSGWSAVRRRIGGFVARGVPPREGRGGTGGVVC
jgi:hypothetical protein